MTTPSNYPTNFYTMTGFKPGSPSRVWLRNRAPTSADFRNYAIGDLWVDENISFWGLLDIVGSVANWQPLGGSAVQVATLTGNTGGAVPPTSGNINVLGSGFVSVAGNPGTSTLTLSVSGTGLVTWQTISASQTLAVNHGYICSGGAALALALPAVSAVGDIIEITLDGSTSFQITQAAGQSIKVASGTSTVGVGGSVTSTMQGDAIRLVCSVANLRWNALSTMGNFTVV